MPEGWTLKRPVKAVLTNDDAGIEDFRDRDGRWIEWVTPQTDVAGGLISTEPAAFALSAPPVGAIQTRTAFTARVKDQCSIVTAPDLSPATPGALGHQAPTNFAQIEGPGEDSNSVVLDLWTQNGRIKVSCSGSGELYAQSFAFEWPAHI